MGGKGGGVGEGWVVRAGATYRAEVEVVGERSPHVGIGHMALDLRHMLVQPLQQELLPRLLRGRVRVRARVRARVGVLR